MEWTQEGIAISVEGEIMYANIAIRNMFGYSGNDMLGVNELQLITPEKRDDYAASLDSSFFETTAFISTAARSRLRSSSALFSLLRQRGARYVHP